MPFELEVQLSGEKKSTTRLTFERRRDDGTTVRLERAVKRERAEDETAVPVATLLDSLTGYVRVTTFMGEKVADDLHSALDRLEKGGMRRLLLDLRDNGGGSVAEAASVAGEFLPRGTDGVHVGRAEAGDRRHGAGEAVVLARGAPVSDRRAGERGDGQRVRAGGGRAAGSRSRADRGASDVREVAAACAAFR